MKRIATITVLALLVGCQSAPTRIAAGDASAMSSATTMPVGTAIVRETDGVVVVAANGTSTKRSVRFFPAFTGEPRYELPAGPCVLELKLSGQLRSGPVSGGPKSLSFKAIGGHSYTLHSRVAPGSGGALGNDQWDVRLVDDAAFVAETTDMPSR